MKAAMTDEFLRDLLFYLAGILIGAIMVAALYGPQVAR